MKNKLFLVFLLLFFAINVAETNEIKWTVDGAFTCVPSGVGTNVTCTKGALTDTFVVSDPTPVPPPPPPPPPPAGTLAFSAVSALNIAATSADITFTVSKLATGQVEYGLTPTYGQLSTKETSFKYTTHLQHLSNLVANSHYHFRINSESQDGTKGTSDDFTFTTLGGVVPSPIPITGSCITTPTSSTVVSVASTGATPNDTSDDTAAMQKAVDQVAGTGGTVLVPDGTYMMNAVNNSLLLKSNMTFRLSSGAILKVIPNGQQSYELLRTNGASNLNIVGGTLQGDRNQHSGSGGEWGMGINLPDSTNVGIQDITTRDMWGDGIYIGAGLSRNIRLCGVTADSNRRQGLSVINADGVVITNSTFKNTDGTWPQCGIDLEPNGGTSSNNVNISSSKFSGNHNSCGFMIYNGAGPVTNTVLNGVALPNQNVTVLDAAATR